MTTLDRAVAALIDVRSGDKLMPEALRNITWDEPTWYEPGDAQLTIFGPLWQLGWTTEQIWEVIREYKRFFELLIKNEQPLVPPLSVDILWCVHRNYPQSYATFCQSVLDKVMADYGGDLDKMEKSLTAAARALFEHDLGTSSDTAKYADQHRSTVGFYLEVFGQPPLHIWSEPAPIAGRPGGQ
jgi:hypothetical protein